MLQKIDFYFKALSENGGNAHSILEAEKSAFFNFCNSAI